MKFVVLSRARKEYEIDVKSPHQVVINGKPINVEILEEKPAYMRLLVNRKVYLVETDRSDRLYTLRLNGKEFQFTVETPYLARRKEAGPVAETAEIIKSPIPGKVVAILVEEGQSVNTGDVLLLLEAMKMQNEIISPRAGIVKQILVEEEQTVSTNEELLVIE
ncbi:MAG: biotin/lipoyl-containing protein [bacterium JZ-2024 1]